MGKKSTPKAPAAPDYAAAAIAQGTANTDAARVGAELANTNQVTPYGSQTFAKNPGSDQWTSTVSLSPDQQRLYDLNSQGDQQLAQMANSQLGRINSAVSQPFDTSGAPDRVSSVGGTDYSLYGGAAPTYGKYTGQSMDMPDYGTQAKEVEDSLYRSSTARLDPQFAQAENAERTRLINAGVAEGSEAFTNAMGTFNQNKNAAYGDARDRAIQGRGQEQSRLNNDFYTGNAQKFGQDITALNTNNSASGQQFDDQLKALGFNNQAEAQTFADRIAGGNFQNTQRGAAIDEAAYMRNEPLNLYSALASGSQVTQPQFRGTGQAQGPAAAPTFAATQASDQRAIDLYNAQLASSGSAQGGLMQMGGALGGAAIKQWSDRRLKSDIRQIGSLANGLPVYSYMIFGSPDVGVMADEVRAILPAAVTRMPNGYDMVDYSKVLA